ncbi:MAG: hypothetical protein GY822_27250 [Deltaproteobacteria bacterium]|nr:hypothetical protein [Deltaproteobacteria bacterium]
MRFTTLALYSLLLAHAGMLLGCPDDDICQTDSDCGPNQECVSDESTLLCVDIEPQVAIADAGVIVVDLPVLQLDWDESPTSHEGASLTWSASGAETCRLKIGEHYDDDVEKRDSLLLEVLPGGLHEAVLTCDNAAGVSVASASLDVIGEASVDVQLSASNLAFGDALVVNIQAGFVSSCDVDIKGVVTHFVPDEGLLYGGILYGSLDASFEQILDESATVSVSCDGISADAIFSQEVRIGGILSFAADTPVVQGSQSVTFRWNTESDGCILGDGTFSQDMLPSVGDAALTLTQTATLTLTCLIGEREVVQSTQVFVIDGVSFDVDGPLPFEGQSEFTTSVGFMGEAPQDVVCGIEFPDATFAAVSLSVDTASTEQTGTHRLRCGMNWQNVDDYLLLASIALYDAVTIIEFDLVMKPADFVILVDTNCSSPKIAWKTHGATACTLQGAAVGLEGETLIADVVNGTAEEVILACDGVEGQQVSQTHRIWMQPATTPEEWNSLRLYEPTITTETLTFPTEETGIQELPASIVGTCGAVVSDPTRTWASPSNLRKAHLISLSGGTLIDFPALTYGNITHNADSASVTIRAPLAKELLIMGGNEFNNGTITEYSISAPALETLSFIFYTASSLDITSLSPTISLFNGFYQDETTNLFPMPNNVQLGTLFFYPNDLTTEIVIEQEAVDFLGIVGGSQLETFSMPNLKSISSLGVGYTSVQNISLPLLEDAGTFSIQVADDLTTLEIPLLHSVQDLTLKSNRSLPCDDVEALIAQLNTPPTLLDATIDANNCVLP